MANDFKEFSYLSPMISSGNPLTLLTATSSSSSSLPTGAAPLPPPPPPPLSPVAFNYTPLRSSDSIRLVRIQAAAATTTTTTNTTEDSSSADVELEIIQTRLPAAPPYEAISYTWGDERELHHLPCASAPNSNISRYIAVMPNCTSVLRRLRSPAASRLIWLDAVCIDQTNIAEKNAQVALMGRIYRQAQRVVIDIGEADKRSAHALDAICHCSESALYSFDTGLEIRDSVCELYRRPWFSRVWVLQEAFMAADAVVLCGDQLVPWQVFRPFEIWVDSRPAGETENWHVKLPSMVPYALTVGSCKTRSYTAHKDFLALLCKSRTCAATDPRDKVFALLPMLEDAEAEGLEADYAKDTVQVFTKTAEWLVSLVGLDFLPCVSGESNVEALPSWVPDWSIPIREPWMIGLGDVYYPLSAGGGTKPVAEVVFPTQVEQLRQTSPNSSVRAELKVRGVKVDTLRTISGELNIRTNSNALSEFVTACRAHRTTHPLGPISLPRVRYWEPRTWETRLHPPTWMSYIYGIPLPSPISETDNDLAEKATYFCSGRNLAGTERGGFGVVPDRALAGDTVAVFLGSGVCWVLRDAEQAKGGEDRERYQLIGEAYLYGLMQGEALQGLDTESLSSSSVLSKSQKDDGTVASALLQDFYIC